MKIEAFVLDSTCRHFESSPEISKELANENIIEVAEVLEALQH